MNVATLDTPAGPFTAVTDDDGAVLASGWTADAGDLVPLIHPDLRGDGDVRQRADLGPVTAAARAYHEGDLEAIQDVPVVQRSGDFLMHAWDVQRTVEPGEPVTDADYAVLAGRPAPRSSKRARADRPGAQAAGYTWRGPASQPQPRTIAVAMSSSAAMPSSRQRSPSSRAPA